MSLRAAFFDVFRAYVTKKFKKLYKMAKNTLHIYQNLSIHMLVYMT